MVSYSALNGYRQDKARCSNRNSCAIGQTGKYMNARNQGRKKYEGSRRMYTVEDDAHQWIMEHGGGKYLTEIVRAIIANENMRK